MIVPKEDRSTDEAESEALVSENVILSIVPRPGFAVAMTLPRSDSVDAVASRPPIAASLLFSELRRPVLKTAKAKTEATTTKAMRMMAVSRPVMPRWSRRTMPGA